MKVQSTTLAASTAPKGRDEKERADIKKAATEFEAYLTTQLFKQMEAANASISQDRSLGSQFFAETFAEHIARSSAQRGELGIAAVLEREWLRGRDTIARPSEDPPEKPTQEPAKKHESIESLRADFHVRRKNAKNS